MTVDGENTVISLVFNDQAHQVPIDLIGPGGKAVNERGIAQNINHPRNAMAGLRDHLTRAFSEEIGPGTDRGKAEIDVLGHLRLGQWPKVKIGGDPLGKLNEIRLAQQFFELRLPNKNQLKKLVLIDVDVGQHSQTFERILPQVLRFVDDQYCPMPLPVLGV